jgi:hypothetical protein
VSKPEEQEDFWASRNLVWALGEEEERGGRQAGRKRREGRRKRGAHTIRERSGVSGQIKTRLTLE